MSATTSQPTPENRLAIRLLPRERFNRQSPLYATLESLSRNKLAMFGLACLLLMILMSILAPWIAPYSPTNMDYNEVLQAPTWAHPFGTDDLGRDVLSRVIWGGRESLKTGYLAVMIGLGGGIVVGVVSGYLGGKVDALIQRVVEVFLAFPSILLLLSIVAALGPGLVTVMIAIGFSSIPAYSRLVRGSVIATKNLDYVTAAKLIGVKDVWIMIRHILPNIIAPIMIYGTLSLGGAIVLTAGLSYIGLGAQPPSPEWGAMLNYGRQYLQLGWWMSAFPGLAVFITVLSINLFGDGLQQAMNPKTRS
jgi:ABC-type dipeptide/oligopeptide/nickel transport system permease subunit